EHRDELAEVEHAEQERRVRQPVDEDRRGQVLEPGARRGGRIADEVRPEVARADHPPRRRGSDARLCRAHPSLVTDLYSPTRHSTTVPPHVMSCYYGETWPPYSAPT